MIDLSRSSIEFYGKIMENLSFTGVCAEGEFIINVSTIPSNTGIKTITPSEYNCLSEGQKYGKIYLFDTEVIRNCVFHRNKS